MDKFEPKLSDRAALALACAAAFLLPLKLALTYLAVFPLIILWIFKNPKALPQRILSSQWLFVPFLFFTATAVLSSFYGINVVRSLKGIPALLFFSLSILAFQDLASRGRALTIASFLIAGQSVASFYSLVELGSSGLARRLFLGAVTESGQLALSLLLAIGAVLYMHRERPLRSMQTASAPGLLPFRLFVLQGLLSTAIFTLTCFIPYFRNHYIAQALPFLTAAVLVWCFVLGRRLSPLTVGGEKALWFLCTLAIPLMSAALIGNLKRGPWAGVLVGGGLLLFLFERRLLVLLLAGAASALIFLTPVQTRLLQSSRDFFIAGGRSVIWDVGVELSMQYPLGIGLRNSPFLQKFSPEIPPELKHFHSNILNILVETGWVGVALFMWWIFSVITRPLLVSRDAIMAVTAGCALLSWQVAGLVEYNFGDSEVLLVAYLVMGLLGAWVEAPAAQGRRAAPSQEARVL